jgi:mannitol-1-phosphate 5-dehydrogenase
MGRFVQFGAGNIGRSLCSALMSRAGYEVVFVDLDRSLVDALNAKHGYSVIVKDKKPAEIKVVGVRAVGAWNTDAVADEVAQADFAGTAVGPRALEPVFKLIAAGLKKRGGKPLDIILCENQRDAAQIVAGYLKNALGVKDLNDFPVGLIETSIGKMVPIMPNEVRKQDPTVVWAEAYNKIIADGEAFITSVPQIEGLERHSNFHAYVDRKLFVHNLGHAACAYMGALKKKTFIWEAMKFKAAAETAKGAMVESGKALLARYPGEWTWDEMNAHIEDLLERFRNKALGDTVYRVGRDLPRKLAPDDRLLGALRLQAASGVQSVFTERAIAAALLFRTAGEDGKLFAEDAAFAEYIDREGPGMALEKYAKMDINGSDRDVAGRILREYARLGGK